MQLDRLVADQRPAAGPDLTGHLPPGDAEPVELRPRDHPTLLSRELAGGGEPRVVVRRSTRHARHRAREPPGPVAADGPSGDHAVTSPTVDADRPGTFPDVIRMVEGDTLTG
ncbi:ATP-dependent DNA helicase, UvrD/Rep family [Nocardioides sp. PD653]|nr:ATP-dependent DNA helicase, UvrD/Rep family [Nocardioides sp. PD653-B2]GAW52822.1 ATP-dependent DNA helicase, UvrD/Rep family [Nocardioides sp. PD653]